MRRAAFALCLAALPLLALPAFSQDAQADGARSVEVLRQSVMPKELFVGDRAQVSLTFSCPADFAALAPAQYVAGKTVRLDVAQIDGGAQCSVLEAALVPGEFYYTLSMTVVPWQPGSIDLAPFSLARACHVTLDANIPQVVDVSPFDVVSLSQKLGVTEVRPPASPLLVPGTTYVIWAACILLVLALALLVIALARLPAVLAGISRLRERLGFFRNASHTRRGLRRLLKKQALDDAGFCAQWQGLMRGYLSYRFGSPFAAVPASAMQDEVSRLTGGVPLAQAEEAVFDICSLFVRTDYIRYAHDSADSRQMPQEEHAASFLADERKQVVRRTSDAVVQLEKSTRGGGR